MPKKKIRILSQSDSVEEAYSSFTVALEDVNSKFVVFGENLLSLTQRVSTLENLLEQQGADIKYVKEEIQDMNLEKRLA